MNTADFSAYVINLERDVDRREWMVEQLTREKIAFSFFPAVLGAKITGDDKAYHDDPLRSHLSPAEVGCLLSHMRVWSRIAEGDAPFGLIFEDDLHVSAGAGEFVHSLVGKVSKDQVCVHKLETFCARVTVTRQPEMTLMGRRGVELHTNHAGAGAYLMNRATARFLLSIKADFQHNADTEMFDFERRATNDLKVIQWVPAPFIQDMFVRTDGGFTSNLSGDRSDEKAGIFGGKSGVVDHAKDVLRPLYTALYSAMLLPSGRQRAQVPFG